MSKTHVRQKFYKTIAMIYEMELNIENCLGQMQFVMMCEKGCT